VEAQLASRLERVRSRIQGRVVLGRGLLGNRYLAAKLLPFAPDGRYAVLRRTTADVAGDGLPAPPRELWQRWGLSLESYLESGRRDVRAMLATMLEAGAEEAGLVRVLDFGCAEGRMLRALTEGDRELWGVDVNAERIVWAQQHLSPPLRLATTTTAPHLPFPDEYYDFVYGVSVFTHIRDLNDAWFLEVLRVLRPGGFAYVTIHDEHSVDVLLNRSETAATQREMVDLLRRFDAETGELGKEWVYFAMRSDPGAEVFYRSDDLVRRWSLVADLRLKKCEAIGYQTALVFQRR
jgi:SAM-dependent methyltransferase